MVDKFNRVSTSQLHYSHIHFDIFDAADEALFSKILHHSNHLLASLLPNETLTPY